MKKFNFGVLALVLGLTLAITGSAFTPAATTETIYWFASNADGTVAGAYLPDGPPCEEVEGPICALAFTEADLDPQASSPELSSTAQADPIGNSDDVKRSLE